MNKRFVRLIAVAVTAMSLSVMASETVGADTVNVVPPTNPRNTSVTWRGSPAGNTPPTTRPRGTYPELGDIRLPPGHIPRYGFPGDLICIAYDYIKDACVAWRKKRDSSNIQIWNAYGGGAILNHIWASPSEAEFVESGYFGTRNNNQRYCHAWDYTVGLCAGWNPAVPPYIAQYPVMNYIWVNGATIQDKTVGYFGTDASWWTLSP